MNPSKKSNDDMFNCVHVRNTSTKTAQLKRDPKVPRPKEFEKVVRQTLNQADKRPSVILPEEKDEIIPFAKSLGDNLANGNIYVKNGAIVEVLDHEKHPILNYLNHTTLPEAVEKYCKLVRVVTNKNLETNAIDGSKKSIPKSSSKSYAVKVCLPWPLGRKLVESSTFKSRLPEIRFVETVRLPVIRDREMILLPKGYDPISMIWSADSVPYKTDMSVEDAVAWLREYFSQFEFADEGRSLAVVIALAVSEYAKYILPPGTLRCAIATVANSHGAGKTIILKMALGGVHGALPATAWPRSNDELRKKLAGAFASGDRILIFDNVKNTLDSDVLEAVITSPIWQDRILGLTVQTSWRHESQICISGNNMRVGRDMSRRLLLCNLKQTNERPEERTVERPFTERSLEEARPTFLAALHAITKNWIDKGCPKGPTIRAGFEEWSSVIGGIVTAAGFADPIENVIGGDINSDDNDFRALVFAMACGRHSIDLKPAIASKSGASPAEIRDFLAQEELFMEKLSTALTPQARGSVVGKILQMWVGRNCAGYVLRHDDKVGARRKYWVERTETN